MNHYVNGITNLSMSDGVVTFNYAYTYNNDKGEKITSDEVSISMTGNTFNALMTICNDLIQKVKENIEKTNEIPIEENSAESQEKIEEPASSPKKRGRAKKD